MSPPLLRRLSLASALLLVLGPIRLSADEGAEKPATLKVVVDYSEVPELKEWAEKAKALVEEWHPKIAKRLESEGFTPPDNVKIIFKKNMRGVAGTSGNRISVSAKWVQDHPEDFGMVIHEYVHVVQSYPKYEHVWLVEGIADYIRYHEFEPDRKPRFDIRRARHTDGYGVTAAFLAWVQEKYEKELVSKLNACLRKTEYKDELWKEYTGKTLDELWKEFVESRPMRRPRNT